VPVIGDIWLTPRSLRSRYVLQMSSPSVSRLASACPSSGTSGWLRARSARATCSRCR